MRTVFQAHKGSYGALRDAAELRKGEELPLGRHRVARLRRKFGMIARPHHRFRGTTTDADHDLPVADHLLQGESSVPAPKMAVVGEPTYLPTRTGWVQLAVLIDLCSRKVVDWALDTHMKTEPCIGAFDRMVASRGDMTGAIVHRDRGSHDARRTHRRRVEAAKVTLSGGGNGSCSDSAVLESCFGTLGQELAPNAPWTDVKQARAAVSDDLHRYDNLKRSTPPCATRLRWRPSPITTHPEGSPPDRLVRQAGARSGPVDAPHPTPGKPRFNPSCPAPPTPPARPSPATSSTPPSSRRHPVPHRP